MAPRSRWREIGSLGRTRIASTARTTVPSPLGSNVCCTDLPFYDIDARCARLIDGDRNRGWLLGGNRCRCRKYALPPVGHPHLQMKADAAPQHGQKIPGTGRILTKNDLRIAVEIEAAAARNLEMSITVGSGCNDLPDGDIFARGNRPCFTSRCERHFAGGDGSLCGIDLHNVGIYILSRQQNAGCASCPECKEKTAEHSSLIVSHLAVRFSRDSLPLDCCFR